MTDYLNVLAERDKTPGQIAYEEDVRRHPFYHDGTSRKSWNELGEIEQLTWHRNPTPRIWTRRMDKES